MDKTIALFIAENKERIRNKCEGRLFEVNGILLNNTTKDECIKHLIPNTIVSGVIENISYDNLLKKKNQIVVRIKTPLALITDEDKEENHKIFSSSIDFDSYNITGIISIDEIYDKQLIHLNDIIDSNLMIGTEITTLITSINHDAISLSLRNTLIKGKRQTFIKENDYLIHIPLNLGMKIDHSSEEKNERYLESKITQYKLNQYGFKVNCKEFHYDILRKVQNYDWSDEYISKGDLLAQEGLHFLAVENYEEAEKLDPLDTEIYIKKGNACLKVGDFNKAIHSFKNCLKIDPCNLEARVHIEELYKRKTSKLNGMYLHNKKNHE